MTTETNMTPAPQTSAAKPVPPINVTPSGLVGLKMYEREIATYLRELPRLIDEGYAWKHTLIKGEEILGIWDTQNDAIQAGVERFGLEPIFVKTIDPRDPERFALLQAWKDAQCPS